MVELRWMATFLERQISSCITRVISPGEAGTFLTLSVQLRSTDCSIWVTPKEWHPKPLLPALSCPHTCSVVSKNRKFPPKTGSGTQVSVWLSCQIVAKFLKKIHPWPNVEAFNSNRWFWFIIIQEESFLEKDHLLVKMKHIFTVFFLNFLFITFCKFSCDCCPKKRQVLFEKISCTSHVTNMHWCSGSQQSLHNGSSSVVTNGRGVDTRYWKWTNVICIFGDF